MVKQGTISNFYTYIEPPTAALRPNSIEDSISNGKVKLECESDSVQLQSNGAVWYLGTFSASTTPYQVPTYKITYGDAILLTDGTTADFVLTVTNEQFYITSASPQTNTPLFVQKGFNAGVTNSVNPTSFVFGSGKKSDARDIKITVEKDGTPVDCSLLLSMVDVDVEGVLTNQLGTSTDSPSMSYNTTQASFLESVVFNAEDEGLLSDIYVPTTSYFNVVTENGQLKLLPTKGDSNTYNSGFAVLISGKGANVHWEGSACYSSFTLPDVALAYNIAAEVTQNSVGAGPGLGTITTTATYSEDNVQTVSTTNANNTYKSALNITHGTNAVCTITPDEGYVIDTFTIDGSAVAPPARNTDGSYTYTFSDNTNHEITASFGIEKTVTYKTSEHGSVNKEIETVVQGHTPTGATPTADTGYAFNKWVADKAVTLSDGTKISSGDTITQAQLTKVVITEDVTFTAKFKVGSAYTINYVLDGGTNASTNPDDYTVETPTITLADPSRVGYTFTGWTTTGVTTPTKALTIPKGSTGEKTFTANWSINQYTVTFDSHGGTNVASQSVDYNATATEPNPAPTKDGLVFAGWYTSTTFTSDNKYNFNTPVTDNMTLHACWQATVSFVTNTNDSQTVASQAADEGGYATKPSDSLTKAGYTFEGWYDTPDFSGDVFDFASSAITENTTLYAKWSPETYTITYVLDGGTNASTNPTTYTVESDTITLLSPTREGYTFTGWTGAEVSEPTKGLVIPKGSVGNKTFTAHWESTVQPVPQPDNNNTTPEPDKTDPEKTTTTSTEGTVAKMGDALGAVVQALIACCVLGTGAVWVVCKRKRN